MGCVAYRWHGGPADQPGLVEECFDSVEAAHCAPARRSGEVHRGLDLSVNAENRLLLVAALGIRVPDGIRISVGVTDDVHRPDVADCGLLTGRNIIRDTDGDADSIRD